MLNARQCVLYSGGAAGTEQFFGALAEGWGIEEVNYSFEGHQIERKRGVRVLTSEELALKDVSLAYVSKLMNREYTRAPLFRKVLQSICWQVSSGSQVIVVGVTIPSKAAPAGERSLPKSATSLLSFSIRSAITGLSGTRNPAGNLLRIRSSNSLILPPPEQGSSKTMAAMPSRICSSAHSTKARLSHFLSLI